MVQVDDLPFVFLSHVSEDKEQIVRPFARALFFLGIPYWLDEAELKWAPQPHPQS